MGEYQLLRKLGEGSFGTVYEGKVRKTGQMVAIKRTRMQSTGVSGRLNSTEEFISINTLREIASLKLLSHCENIVKLLAVEVKEIAYGVPMMSIVFEYLDCDLFNYYSRFSSRHIPIPPLMIKNIMYQLLKGIEYGHRHEVMHRDLKPKNILLDLKLGVVKVADLGLARVLRKSYEPYTQEVATLWYRAPELLLGETNYTFAIDIWSIGCIFAELCIMKPFLKGDSHITQIFKVIKKLGTPNEEIWPGVTQLEHWSVRFPNFSPKNLADEIPNLDEYGLDLLSKLLRYDPSRRISARDALSHPYFFDVQASHTSFQI